MKSGTLRSKQSDALKEWQRIGALLKNGKSDIPSATIESELSKLRQSLEIGIDEYQYNPKKSKKNNRPTVIRESVKEHQGYSRNFRRRSFTKIFSIIYEGEHPPPDSMMDCKRAQHCISEKYLFKKYKELYGKPLGKNGNYYRLKDEMYKAKLIRYKGDDLLECTERGIKEFLNE